MPSVKPFDNNSQIPAPRVPIFDALTNYVSRAWYRWFYNVYVSLEAGRRYGSFYDTTTQTAAATNTAYPITLNTTAVDADNVETAYGVYRGTDTSRVYVDNTAIYNVQFSLQLSSTDVATKLIWLWPRINGNDVVESATKITMKGASEAYVAAWNFVLKLNKGDYFQLVWAVDNTNVSILAQAASAPIPAIPSVILTVTSSVGV